MIKRDIRVLLADTADRMGVMTLSELFMNQRLTVLTYHRVLPDSLMKGYFFPSLAVSETVFAQQIAFLVKHFQVVRLDEGLERIKTSAINGKSLVAITFDDGYADNWIHAIPILRRNAVQATFFVVSDLVDTENSLWYDVAARCWSVATASTLFKATEDEGIPISWPRYTKPSISSWLAHMKRMDGDTRAKVIQGLNDPGPVAQRKHLDRIMSSRQLQSLIKEKHLVGSHTCSHPLLPQLDDLALKVELVKSKSDLESILQHTVNTFCYPNGDHDQRVVDAVISAGYILACTTNNSKNTANLDELRIGRINMNLSKCIDSNGLFHAASLRASLNSLFH